MVETGHTMMCEQRAPENPVEDLAYAERAGFGLSTISDHYQPWPGTAECRSPTREQFEPPNPINFAAATEGDIAGLISCGPSAEVIAAGVEQFVDAASSGSRSRRSVILRRSPAGSRRASWAMPCESFSHPNRPVPGPTQPRRGPFPKRTAPPGSGHEKQPLSGRPAREEPSATDGRQGSSFSARTRCL